MIAVSKAVSDILQTDELAQESLLAGFLNFSAYADSIQKEVEKRTYKEVKHGTIVVALTRIAKQFSQTPALKPAVEISNISVKSPLAAFTYTKTLDIQRRVATLNPFLLSANDLFAITEGISEITLFCSEKSIDFIKTHLGEKPINHQSNLAAVTIQLDPKYTKIPNVLYVLFSAIATQRILLLGTVSTHTEISFVVNKDDMEALLKVLNVYSKSEKGSSHSTTSVFSTPTGAGSVKP